MRRIAQIVFAVACVGGLVVSVLAIPAAATSPGTNGLIAFESERDGPAREIYVMNPDGSGQTRRTTNTADDRAPAYSGDGTRIAFTSNRDSDLEIYGMNADGSAQTRLTESADTDDTPAFSPDGSKIAFSSRRDGGGFNSDIYVMNADGSGPTRLTEAAGLDFNPVYSPDGQRIAFESTRDPADEVYAMNADGSGEVDLTNNPADDGSPSYSPDGQRIAFASFRDGNSEIYVMNADGSGQTRLTTNSAFDDDPAFSPDGQRIAFVSNRDGNLEIYVMNADGSGQTRLTTNGAADLSPDWQTLDPTPPPPPPPPPPGSPPVNVERPTIVGSQIPRLADTYTCDDGAWQGLPPDPAFAYKWYRNDGSVFKARWNVVGQERTYRIRNPEVGKAFVCEVSVANASGRSEAQSDPKVLTGAVGDPEFTLPKAAPYGDYAVLGIDVFQVVQPNSCAQTFEPGAAFPNYAGGGTPTAYMADSNCAGFQLPDGANPQQVPYRGVTLDDGKPTTATVYVAMRNNAPTPAGQLDVTLTASVGGSATYTSTQTIGRPPFAERPFVTGEQRDGITGGQRIGFQFELPSYLLYAAAGKSISLTADVSPPVKAALLGFNQCGASDCSANDRFRLYGVPVDSPPLITIASLELIGRPPATAPDQSALPAADKLLATSRRVLPGGSRMIVQPYSATLDTGFEMNFSMADHDCTDLEFKDVRSCRQYYVGQRVEKWRWETTNRLGGVEPWDVLFAAHDYAFDNGAGPEPGWMSGGTPPLLDPKYLAPLFTSNAGGTRPYTATTHELGHVLGAPHAGQSCTGTGAGDSQAGEPWPADDMGRLQGTNFDIRRRGNDGLVQPLADAADNQLFDLMSYCAAEGNARLSPRNWGRSLDALLAYGAAQRSALRTNVAGQASAGAGRVLVSGVLGEEAGRIVSVTPLPGGEMLPSDPSSSLRLRAFAADGALLEESGAAVAGLLDASDSGGTFTGTVPDGAAAIELVRDGSVLDRRQRTQAPSVRLLSPKQKTKVSRRGRLVVRWRASDPEGDELAATVEYSADGGRSWRIVYDGPSNGVARLDGGSLVGSGKARVRVNVTDGFSQVSARSGRFEVAGAPPVVEMLAPTKGEPATAGDPVQLAGAAVAADGRRLSGRALTWFVGKRRLGTGERLKQRFSPGRVKLRLVAEDRGGRRSASVARTLRVSPRPLRVKTLSVPPRVDRRARRVRVKISASGPAILQAGGRRFRLGTGAKQVEVPLPRNPRTGAIRVPFELTPRGTGARGRVAGSFFVVRS